MDSSRRKNKLGDTSKGYLPQHMLKNLLETSESILEGGMSLGEQGLPGWEARAVGMAHEKCKGKESLPACLSQPRSSRIFELLPDDKGNSSHTGLATEKAPWLQAQQAGEAPEGHIPYSVSSTQCHVLGAASVCSLVSNPSAQFAHLPHAQVTVCPSCTPLGGSQVQSHSPCKSVDAELVWGSHASPALTIPCPC